MTGSERIEAWFTKRGWKPFPFQREVWDAYARGESGLIHAATGTGKTYAAWLGAVSEWLDDPPPVVRKKHVEPLRALWITPLRALAGDTVAALERPIRDLNMPWTVEERTGDTSSAARARQRR